MPSALDIGVTWRKATDEDLLIDLASKYFAGLRKHMTGMLRNARRPKDLALQSSP